jgi:hypothetical protein
MASQEETCWNCGAAYAPAARPDTMRAAPIADARWDDDGGTSVVVTNGVDDPVTAKVRLAVDSGARIA